MAASTDVTGGTGLGGNWEFEYFAGDVESEGLFGNGEADDYAGLLKRIVVTGSGADDRFLMKLSTIQLNANDPTGDMDADNLYEMSGKGGADQFEIRRTPVNAVSNATGHRISRILGGSGTDTVDFSGFLDGHTKLTWVFDGNPNSDIDSNFSNDDLLSIKVHKTSGTATPFKNISNVEKFVGSDKQNVYQFKNTWVTDWNRDHEIDGFASYNQNTGATKDSIDVSSINQLLDVKARRRRADRYHAQRGAGSQDHCQLRGEGRRGGKPAEPGFLRGHQGYPFPDRDQR